MSYEPVQIFMTTRQEVIGLFILIFGLGALGIGAILIFRDMLREIETLQEKVSKLETADAELKASVKQLNEKEVKRMPRDKRY